MLNLADQPVTRPQQAEAIADRSGPHKPPVPIREPLPPPEEQPEPKLDPPSGPSEPPTKWVTHVSIGAAARRLPIAFLTGGHSHRENDAPRTGA